MMSITQAEINYIKALQAENVKLRKLVALGHHVVLDFMPNIGKCVLQDYKQLNDFLIQAEKIKKQK